MNSTKTKNIIEEIIVVKDKKIILINRLYKWLKNSTKSHESTIEMINNNKQKFIVQLEELNQEIAINIVKNLLTNFENRIELDHFDPVLSKAIDFLIDEIDRLKGNPDEF